MDREPKRTRRRRIVIGCSVASVLLVLLVWAVGWDCLDGYPPDRKRMAATLDVKAIASAVDMYEIKHSRLPATLEDLVPADLAHLSRDPWGTPYQYLHADGRYWIQCFGPDRNPGGDDDIVAPGQATPGTPAR